LEARKAEAIEAMAISIKALDVAMDQIRRAKEMITKVIFLFLWLSQ